jgi:hypothetical protein
MSLETIRKVRRRFGTWPAIGVGALLLVVFALNAIGNVDTALEVADEGKPHWVRTGASNALAMMEPLRVTPDVNLIIGLTALILFAVAIGLAVGGRFYKPSEDVESLRRLFIANAEPAYKLADRLLGRIAEQLLNRNHPNASESNRAAGTLIELNVRDTAHSALALLRQCLDGRDAPEVQMSFGDFYRHYQGLSTWISRGGELISFQAQDDREYLNWRKRDAEFLSQLNRLTAGSGYEALRREVEAVGWGEGTRTSGGHRPEPNDAVARGEPASATENDVPPPVPTRVLKVRATQALNPGRRIRRGEEFTIAKESDFVSTQMEPIDWTPPVSLDVSMRWLHGNLSYVGVKNRTTESIDRVRVTLTHVLILLPNDAWIPADVRGVKLPCLLKCGDREPIRPGKESKHRFLNTVQQKTLKGEVFEGLSDQGAVKVMLLREYGSHRLRFLVEWDGTNEQEFEARFKWNETLGPKLGDIVPVRP